MAYSRVHGTLVRVPVSISTATTTAIAAASADHFYRVINAYLSSGGTNTVQFKSGSNNLTGAMDMISGQDITWPDSDAMVGWLQSNRNEALNITTTEGVDLMGHVTLLKYNVGGSNPI